MAHEVMVCFGSGRQLNSLEAMSLTLSSISKVKPNYPWNDTKWLSSSSIETLLTSHVVERLATE